MVLSSKEVGIVEDQALLSAALSWDYRNYARLRSVCFDSRQFLRLTVDGSSSSVYEH